MINSFCYTVSHDPGWSIFRQAVRPWCFLLDCDGSPLCLPLRIEHCVCGGLHSSRYLADIHCTFQPLAGKHSVSMAIAKLTFSCFHVVCVLRSELSHVHGLHDHRWWSVCILPARPHPSLERRGRGRRWLQVLNQNIRKKGSVFASAMPRW